MSELYIAAAVIVTAGLMLAALLLKHKGGVAAEARHHKKDEQPADVARRALECGEPEEIARVLADAEQLARWKKALATGDAADQADIALAAAKYGGNEGVRWLLEMWQHPGPGVQMAVSAALSQHAGPQLLDRLIPLLHSNRAGLPTRVAEVVLAIGEEAVGALVEHLQQTDDGKEIIIQLLGEMGGTRAADALAECLADPEESVRREAVVALGKMERCAAGIRAVLSALQDESWQVQAQAARVAGMWAVLEAAPELNALRESPRWEVSTQAKEALKRVSTEETG